MRYLLAVLSLLFIGCGTTMSPTQPTSDDPAPKGSYTAVVTIKTDGRIPYPLTNEHEYYVYRNNDFVRVIMPGLTADVPCNIGDSLVVEWLEQRTTTDMYVRSKGMRVVQDSTYWSVY